ncbi:hypothetical protein POTOM_045258 [Populus tomentosa]|uniref:Uncharacterized protein n=1 Tax=Populus tomentosa TaxID=118781 RepID=A0A8X7YDG0_POPTO|nr:hypothetical protein POTOM_045258 [Populus tomentosa]
MDNSIAILRNKRNKDMQSQQGLFTVKRQVPKRQLLTTVRGRGRGRGRGINPCFGTRSSTDEKQYTFQATEKISLGDVEFFDNRKTDMQSQQGLFTIKRQVPKRQQQTTVRGRGRGITPYFGQRSSSDEEQYTYEGSPPTEAGSSSATCQNCKTYRSQIAQLIDQINKKDEQIQSLYEQIMTLEA